ncbi:MAG TPA: sulfatase [Actinomycetota bacterium]|nr:sulfatase [Actinomycetota bacterium]
MNGGPREPTAPSTRIGLALTLAIAAIAWGVVVLPDVGGRERTPPNVVVIVTDDQTVESIPGPTPVMPFLQERALDPDDHWVVFENAFVNTPLCCPSRATMLTGRFSHETGVVDNDHGRLLDEDATVASWLHDEGYHTGLVGKYLNGYPFGRPPFVPRGWDSWSARRQGPVTSLYYDYTLIEQGMPVSYGDDEADYSTDVLAARAVEFVREAPFGRPFFLWFAPTAPHPPWTPAPRHEGSYSGLAVPSPPSTGEPDVSDKPAWVRELPPPDAATLASYQDARRRSYETLLAVDEAVRAVIQELRARGELRRTVIVFTSDNGLAFGEHRWAKKTCAYDECLRVPFLVRMPGVEHRVETSFVSTVDLAPTIAGLAGVEPPRSVAGSSLVRLLRTGRDDGLPDRVYAEWVGEGLPVPGWWALRTPGFAYVELTTGERELYALREDPFELENVVDEPRFAAVVERLSAALDGYIG